jgi:hypothetical protein
VLLTSEAGTTLGRKIHLSDWKRGETDLGDESVIKVRQSRTSAARRAIYRNYK